MLRYFIIVCLAVFAGCRSTPEETAPAPKNVRVQTDSTPVIQPVAAITGRVIAVRESLGFVVVDFAGSRPPRLEQRLNVYRLDQKVAELKVSGPFRGTTAAADIVAGRTVEGDLVRDR